MLDPQNRRFLYPFITCINCGSRYSIVDSSPYERKYTTMNKFSMCADCRKEYFDPLDRRYNSETNACKCCGPVIDIKSVISSLKEGKVLALKGIGGFNFICDACNIKAVEKIRKIKHREFKPLAIMAANLELAEKECFMSYEEKNILMSKIAPIVLLKKRSNHFDYMPIIGGDICNKEIWRLNPFRIEQNDILKRMLEKNINVFWSSSVGRLFDLIANLTCGLERIEYESQGAVKVEEMYDDNETRRLDFSIIGKAIRMDIATTYKQIEKESPSAICSMFHNTLIDIAIEIAKRANVEYVVLSGGCFYNSVLVQKITENLNKLKMKVYTQRLYPCGDGGLSLGQAASAMYRLM